MTHQLWQGDAKVLLQPESQQAEGEGNEQQRDDELETLTGHQGDFLGELDDPAGPLKQTDDLYRVESREQGGEDAKPP